MYTISFCSLNNLPISRNRNSIEKNVTKRKIELVNVNETQTLTNIKKIRGQLEQKDILVKNLIVNSNTIKTSRGALQTNKDSLQRLENLNTDQRQIINLIPQSKQIQNKINTNISISKNIPAKVSHLISNNCIEKKIIDNETIKSNSINIKSNQQKKENINKQIDVKSYNPKIHNLDDFEIIKESKPFELDKIKLWPYLLHFIKSCVTIDISDFRKYKLPSFLSFRSKSSGIYQLNNDLEYETQKIIGKGTFGHAILSKIIDKNITASHNKEIILKVDKDICYVVWEVYIHSQLMKRLSNNNSNNNNTYNNTYNNTNNLREYERLFISPISIRLYNNSSVMAMPYAAFGTLFNAINILQKGLFSAEHHEYICGYLVLQMIESIILLHCNGVLHADIKTDNFVLKSHENDDYKLQLSLIDLGKAKDLKQKIITSKHTLSPKKTKKYIVSTIISPMSQNSSVSTESIKNNEIVEKLYCRRIDLSSQEFFSGKSGANNFCCEEMRNNKKWCYEADYFGVCSCMHQLLFFSPLITTTDSIQNAENRGFIPKCKRENNNNCITIPQVSLKRYWNKTLWTEIYMVLLNTKTSTICSFEKIIDIKEKLKNWLSKENVLLKLMDGLSKLKSYLTK